MQTERYFWGIQGDEARSIYGRDLVLIRPDLHVVWRGNSAPDDPGGLAAAATGHQGA
jgi:hypothetical protein